jgi:ADP-heptose:LPS heptosyltransferase
MFWLLEKTLRFIGKQSLFYRVEYLLKNPEFLGALIKNRILGYQVLLVFRKGGAGDIICTLPMVEKIKRNESKIIIVYQTLTQNLDIPRMCRSVDVSITDSEVDTFWFNYFFKPKKIFNPTLPPEHDWTLTFDSIHLVEHLAQSCGYLRLSVKQSFLTPSHEARKKVKKILKKLSLNRKEFAVIHVGATWAVKEWPEYKWDELIKMLRLKTNLEFVQVGQDFTASAMDRPCQRIPGTLSLVGELSFQETAALLEKAQIFIGIDSGVLHLAGSVKTPIVGIFGPTNPSFYLPRLTTATAVTADVECLGCQHAENGCLHWKTGCPNNIKCMSSLEADKVFNAVFSIVKAN